MPKRSRLVLLLAGAAVLGLAALGLAVLWARDDERRRPLPVEESAPAHAEAPLAPPALAEALPVQTGPDAARRQAPDPEPTAPEGEPAGAWLRLLEQGTGAPLAHFEMRLLVFDPRQAADARPLSLRVSSDAEGRFDLVIPQAAHPLLRVHASPLDPRLGFTPGSFEWRELGATPASALELFLAPRPLARLHGRALDARSGEPLPSLAFHVAGWRAPASAEPGAPPVGSPAHGWLGVGYPGPIEWIVTDARGDFASTSDHPLGWLLLRTLHEEETRVELDASGAPLEARFEVGPVVRLDFDPPGGRHAEDFVAGLYRDPGEAGLDEELLDPPSPWSARAAGSWGNAAPVLAGPPPWVRLSSEALAEPLPSHLVVVSRDGGAKGAARIDDFVRHRTEPLSVPVAELASLVVRFHRPHGGDDQQVVVTLHDETRGERLAQRWETREHEVRFQGLAPGPYRIELRAEPDFSRELALVLPLAGPLDVELPELRTSGDLALEGEVVTESGQPLDGRDGRAHLLLTVIVGGRGHGARPAWSSAEPGRGRFRVEDLAPGECRVLASFQSGAFEVEPKLVTATLPGPPVLLRVKDGMRQERFELVLLDPPTEGEVVVVARSTSTRLRIHSSTGADERRLQPDGREALRIELGPYPEGAFESLEVRAEGRRTRIVSRAELRREGQVLRAELELAQGWSGRFRVSAFDGEREPLAGIVLALDGVPLAPSGADGSVLAEAEAKPERLSLVTAGWELVEHTSWDDWGTLFSDGGFTLEGGQVDVFLRRAP